MWEGQELYFGWTWKDKRLKLAWLVPGSTWDWEETEGL